MISPTQQTQNLLNRIGKLAHSALADYRRCASGFTSFELFDPKEVVQTRIIAALLDPSGIHGQGAEFLRIFLREIGECSAASSYLDSTQVVRECITYAIEADRRRIDLVIFLPSGRAIGIESKARGAQDQPNQIEDYLDQLKHFAPNNHVLIYLSPDGRKPRNVSPDQWARWTGGDFPCLSCYDYRDLINRWISKCRDRCHSDAGVLKHFLEEFMHFSEPTEERTGPLMTAQFTHDVADEILRSREELIASIAITNSHEAVRQELAKRFLNRLKENLSTAFDDPWEISLPKEEYGYWSVAVKGRSRQWRGFDVRFEIGPDESANPWHRTIGLGIHGIESEKNLCAKLEAEARGIIPGGKGSTGWAYFHREFDDMSAEDIAVLLYDPNSDELDRVAGTMKRVADAVSPILDRYPRRQAKRL